MVLDAVSSFLGLGGSAPPSVRRPVFEIDFGGNADAWRDTITSIRVSAGLFPSVNAVEITYAPEGAPDVTFGVTGEVKLGYSDSSAVLVFTGNIARLRLSVDRVQSLAACDGGSLLAATRLIRSFKQQTAGDIVKNLAGECGVDTDAIEDGVDFPYCVLHGGQNLHQHITALARKSGYIATIAPDGKLNFKPFVAGQPVQTFTYGMDILALRMTESAPPIGEVTVQGEGAAGSEGGDAWHWLIKDPAAVKGSAGAGNPARAHVDPSLRSSDAATGAATGMVDAVRLLKSVGELRVPGAPDVVPGSTIAIADAPSAALNGQCLVRWTRHVYTKREGFVTHIGFSKVGDASGGGGLLETLGSLL